MEIEGVDVVLDQPKNQIKDLIRIDGMGFWVAFGILGFLAIIISVGAILFRNSKKQTSSYLTLIIPTQIVTTPKIVDHSIYVISPITSPHEKSPQTGNISKIIGHYSPYDGSSWEWENEKVTCHALIVNQGKTESDEKIIDDFKQLVKSGNTINKFIYDDFHLNLDLSDLSAEKLSILKNSNKLDQIELSFVLLESEDRGVSTCYSFVKIVDVKPLVKNYEANKTQLNNSTQIPTIAINNPITFIENKNVILKGFYQEIVDDGWGEERKEMCSGLVLTQAPNSILTKYGLPIRERGLIPNEDIKDQLIIVDDLNLNTAQKQLFRQSSLNQQVELTIDVWNYEDLEIDTPTCFTKFEAKSVKTLPK